jgi:hypothetical protein
MCKGECNIEVVKIKIHRMPDALVFTLQCWL